MRKTFAIICTTIIILSIMAIPVCAIENDAPYYWGNISETATSSLLIDQSPINEATNMTITYNEYFGEDGAQKIVEIVKNAYTIGLFGGNVPVAITADLIQDHTDYYLYSRVYCISEVSIALRFGEDTDKLSANIGFSAVNAGVNTTNGNDFMYTYYIMSNGDIVYSDPEYLSDEADEEYTSTRQIYIESQQMEGVKFVAVYNGYTWETSSAYAPECFTSYWATNVGTYSERYDHVLSEYNKTYAKITQDVTYNYELDIPGIITAIPNGAKQIINNAFGFEIFGINVAGLLSVLLIVTIVAFVVKWLMNR